MRALFCSAAISTLLIAFVASTAAAQGPQAARPLTPAPELLPRPAWYEQDKATPPEPTTATPQKRRTDPEFPYRQTLDKKFWALWGFAFGMMVADAELTAHCSSNPRCEEANPVLGKRPSRGRIYGIKLAPTLLGFYFSQRWKRDKHGNTWGWSALPIGIGAINSVGVVLNLARGFPENPKVSQPKIANMPASQVVLVHR